MRVVRAGLGGLHTVRTQWTLYDLLAAHEALDLELYAQQTAHALSKRKH